MNSNKDARQYALATERNRQPILDILLRVIPTKGDILEIASGTGEHAVFFAPKWSSRQWIPSDPNPDARASIVAWGKYTDTTNLALPLEIDTSKSDWFEQVNSSVSAIICINMIHIAPWAACEGLMAGASQLLPSEGIVYLYGPYKRGGQHTAPTNVEFDRLLRDRNPEWGVRDLDRVLEVASDRGLQLQEIVPMPANNLSIVLKKN
jgi:hypothetical protein